MIAGSLLSKLLRNVLVERQLHIFNSNILPFIHLKMVPILTKNGLEL